ncbi:329_t:CDS:2 [Paraglomus occultum]|uniref:329_t:CDS:1 n=1 Tax=Paraglomus occultum TaxID=144539 RepID=A0A9N8W2C1_9GLOM|nr:329_t:CDS:2 [Paraglomus occultum]
MTTTQAECPRCFCEADSIPGVTKYKEAVLRRVKKNNPNFGRFFYGCERFGRSDGPPACEFFKWVNAGNGEEDALETGQLPHPVPIMNGGTSVTAVHSYNINDLNKPILPTNCSAPLTGSLSNPSSVSSLAATRFPSDSPSIHTPKLSSVVPNTHLEHTLLSHIRRQDRIILAMTKSRNYMREFAANLAKQRDEKEREYMELHRKWTNLQRKLGDLDRLNRSLPSPLSDDANINITVTDSSKLDSINNISRTEKASQFDSFDALDIPSNVVDFDEEDENIVTSITTTITPPRFLTLPSTSTFTAFGNLNETTDNGSDVEVEGRSGGGLLTVVMTGTCHIRRVSIDASLLEDKHILEDFVMAAFNDARCKLGTPAEEYSGRLLSRSPLSLGFKSPFYRTEREQQTEESRPASLDRENENSTIVNSRLSMSAEFDSLKEKVKSLEIENDNLKKRAKKLCSTIELEKESLEQTNSDLLKKVDFLQTTKSLVVTKLEELEKEKKILNSKITSLEEDNEKLKAHVDALEEEKTKCRTICEVDVGEFRKRAIEAVRKAEGAINTTASLQEEIDELKLKVREVEAKRDWWRVQAEIKDKDNELLRQERDFAREMEEKYLKDLLEWKSKATAGAA